MKRFDRTPAAACRPLDDGRSSRPTSSSPDRAPAERRARARRGSLRRGRGVDAQCRVDAAVRRGRRRGDAEQDARATSASSRGKTRGPGVGAAKAALGQDVRYDPLPLLVGPVRRERARWAGSSRRRRWSCAAISDAQVHRVRARRRARARLCAFNAARGSRRRSTIEQRDRRTREARGPDGRSATLSGRAVRSSRSACAASFIATSGVLVPVSAACNRSAPWATRWLSCVDSSAFALNGGWSRATAAGAKPPRTPSGRRLPRRRAPRRSRCRCHCAARSASSPPDELERGARAGVDFLNR